MVILSPLSWGEKIRCMGFLDVGWDRKYIPVVFTLQEDDPVVSFGDSRRPLMNEQYVRGVRVTGDSDNVLEGQAAPDMRNRNSLNWRIDKSTMKVEIEWRVLMNYVRTPSGDIHPGLAAEHIRGGAFTTTD